MAFIDSTSSQRVELLRQAEKTANLTRRVTVGSGVLGAPEGVEGGELCTALSEALADIGYGGLPPGGAMVNGGDASPVLALGGDPLVVGTTLVEDGVFEGIEIPETASIVENADQVTVREFDNSSIVSALCPATVSANGLSYVSLPAGIGVASSTSTFPLQNSQGTVVGTNVTTTVSNGKITHVKAPATTGLTVQGGAVSVQNSAGANGIGGTAQVANGVVSAVRLPAASAAVSNGGGVVVANSANTATAPSSTYVIASGNVDRVTLPAEFALVANSTTPLTNIAVTGTFTTGVAFTVAGGVITAITLS